MSSRDWIAADWGTTHLRVWRMHGLNAVAEAQSDKGMGKLSPEEFEPAMLDLVEPWLQEQARTLVLACGMVGARQGWVEAPYVMVPASPGDLASAVHVPVKDDRLDVRILPGVSQSSPPDVMRGEETQIAGFLLDRPGFTGLVCLPGTHSKWIWLRVGQIERFRTFMTGELFALLSGASVLRHSMGESGWDNDAFKAAVEETQSNPGALTEALFGIRAQGLLEGTEAGVARARLSGLLVGAELGRMREIASVDGVTIIGDGTVARIYDNALRSIGVKAQLVPVETATLRGLCAAKSILEGARNE